VGSFTLPVGRHGLRRAREKLKVLVDEEIHRALFTLERKIGMRDFIFPKAFWACALGFEAARDT